MTVSPEVLDAAIAAYQAEWIKLTNERGEYVTANERHRLAMEVALATAHRRATTWGVKVDGNPHALHLARASNPNLSYCGRMLRLPCGAQEWNLPYCRTCNDEAHSA